MKTHICTISTRVISITLATLFCIMLTACQQSVASPSDQTKTNAVGKQPYGEMKWYTAAAANNPATLVTQQIIDTIKEKSGGRINIVLYPGGSLGAERDAFDMVREGTIAFMTTGSSIMSSFYKPIEALSLPFLFKDVEHSYRYHYSDQAQKLFNEKILGITNVRTLAFRNYGYRVLTTKGIHVTKPEDLSGKVIRSMDSAVSRFVIECLGGSPVPVAYAELYIALQTGVVAGQENPISNIVADKFYEVQDNIILTNHQILQVIEIVNEDTWKKFDAEDQQLIEATIKAYMPVSDEKLTTFANEGLDVMHQKGLNVMEPDSEAFRTRAMAMIKEKYGSDTEMMSILGDVAEYE